MFSKLRRRINGNGMDIGAVEFCESCGQVCATTCRSEATLQRARSEAAYRLPIIR